MNTNVRIALCVLGLFFTIFCLGLVGFGKSQAIILGCIIATLVIFFILNMNTPGKLVRLRDIFSTKTKPYEMVESESSTIEKQIDGTTVILLYILSFFIPLAGFIVGAIYASKDEEHYKHVGKNCLIFSVLNLVLGIIIIAAILGSV